MKRKKSVGRSGPAGMSPAAPAGTVAEKPFSLWDGAQICLFSVLLFLAMTVQTGRASVLLPIAALILCVGRGPWRRLRERFCVPVLGFLLFGAVCGFAAIYAVFDSYAVKEYYKLIAAFSVAVILLVRFDRKHVRGLLWGIAAVCGSIAVISSDAAVGGKLFEVFCSVIDALGGSFANIAESASQSRINGIYNDANVTAGIFALGALAGLHLTLSGKTWWERGIACVLTGMNGMGFFLAMSRGAILCFGLALAVYLAAVGKASRTRLFFLMLLNVAVTVLFSIPASSAVATGSGTLPTVLTVLCGVPVFVLYEFPALWLAKKAEGHGAVLVAVAGVLVLAVGVYAVIALRTTGAYTFTNVGYMSRNAELSAGTYTIEADYTGEVTVAVLEYLDNGGLETYYRGLVEEASFVLDEPKDLMIVFYGREGDVLERAALSDGTELPLDYPLLPSFLANRMNEGLVGGNSMNMRIQYDKDGWALFLQKPLFGWGMGSTEGGLTSVQPFYYESLFLHNHVLQVMCDSGLLGIIPFLAFLLGIGWLLLRRLRKEQDPLAAMLLGCWVIANAHGLMEITFSIRAYQCIGFTVLLLPAVLYGTPLVPSEKEHIRRVCGYAAAGLLCLYLGSFAALLESHRIVEREMRAFETNDAGEFMEMTQRWIGMDVFDQEQNKLNFVGNAVILDSEEYNKDMKRYAEDLRKSGTYTACTGLAEYYYLPQGLLSEVFACSREGLAQEASSHEAWNQQVDFYRQTILGSIGPEDAEPYLKGVASLADYLDTYSEGRQEEIRLTEENRTFLDRARNALSNGLEGEAALMYLVLPAE